MKKCVYVNIQINALVLYAIKVVMIIGCMQYYTDPVSGYIFRSKLDALRYLDTGDINLCAIRPRKKDADGNEVVSPSTIAKIQVSPFNTLFYHVLFLTFYSTGHP